MKKRNVDNIIFIITIWLSMIISGCNTKNPITNPTVEDKLCFLEITNCTITKLGEIPEYKDNDNKEEITVSDSEIEEHIEMILESYEKLKPINRTVVRKGDFVNLTYTVYCEGEIVNGSKGEDIKVGAGFFNKEIEKELIGAKKSKTYTMYIQVPEDDENKAFAGKREKIEYRVNEIQYMSQVKLTDEFVQENYNLKTVAELYEYEKENIVNEKKLESINKKKESIVKELIKNSIFDIDSDSIVNYAVSVYGEYEDMALGYGTNIEEFIMDFFNENLEQFYERCCDEAENRIKRFLVIGAIANKENITVSDNDIEKEYKNLKRYSLNDDIVLYKYQVLEKKVLEYLV